MYGGHSVALMGLVRSASYWDHLTALSVHPSLYNHAGYSSLSVVAAAVAVVAGAVRAVPDSSCYNPS